LILCHSQKHGKHKVLHDPEYYEKDGYKADPEYVLVYKPKPKPTRPPSPYVRDHAVDMR